MRVAIDISALKSSHRVRGVGGYVRNLTDACRQTKVADFSFELVESGKISPNCDLIHYPHFDIFFLTLPPQFLKPAIVTIHDLIPLKYPAHFPSGFKGQIRWQIQKYRLKKARAIITDSQKWQREIAAITGFPLEKIYPIPLAAGSEFKIIKNSQLKEKIRNKYHLPLEFVLYTGHANWNKNVLSLAQACEVNQMPLVIAGLPSLNELDKKHPENQPTIELIDKYGQKPWFNNLGFVPIEDLVVIYNLASLYCQPSFDEGFGLPLLEAMSCGCPLVSSNQGSLPEVAGKAATLVDPSADALAGGIKKVRESKTLRKEMIKNGLLQAKKFSWPKVARETIKIYEKVSDDCRLSS